MRLDNESFAKRAAYLGLVTAFAVILGYVDALIPIPMPVPGIKIGLANLAVVCVLYMRGAREALLVSIVRIAIISMLFGNLFSALFSIMAGLSSLLVMTLLRRTKLFTIIGVSIGGAFIHNMTQLIVAAILTHSAQLIYYQPVLAAGGVITGCAIGILADRIIVFLKYNRRI